MCAAFCVIAVCALLLYLRQAPPSLRATNTLTEMTQAYELAMAELEAEQGKA
eukprot:gene47448-25794_t